MSTNVDVMTDVGALTSTDPGVGLAAVRALQRLHDRLEALHVANAREQGWSWQDIAAALAQEAALELDADEIRPVHLLVGVLQSAGRDLSRLLTGYGITVDAVRDRVAADDTSHEESFEDDAEALKAIGIDLYAVRDK